MATGTSTRNAAQLMREEFDAVAARDLDQLATKWDERTIGRFIALDVEATGRDELRAFFAEMFAALSDFRFEVETIHDVDQHTAVGQWRLRGTFDGGAFQGIEPTGRPVDLRGIDVMHFDGEMLAQVEVYFDGLTFARQIGLLPAADSVGDRGMLSAFNALTRGRHAVRRLLDR